MKTIADFAAAINSHDLEKIAALMSDDHTFIDAHGNEMAGKDTMKEGWPVTSGFSRTTTSRSNRFLAKATWAWRMAAQGRGQEKTLGKFRRHGGPSSEMERSDYGRCTLIRRFNSKE
jgi:hypothetical protein